METESAGAPLGIPLRLRPTDLRGLLSSTMVVMQAQAVAADVSLKVSITDDVPHVVHLDPAKIGWSIVSLVGNALRYLSNRSRRTPNAAINVVVTYESGEAVVVEVRDNGPGIPAATVSRLFNRDDLQGPSGLGLLLVHDIVVAHGGSLEVRSSMDPAKHGTSIRLALPNR
jgi:signal transduction histidine kinase